MGGSSVQGHGVWWSMSLYKYTRRQRSCRSLTIVIYLFDSG